MRADVTATVADAPTIKKLSSPYYYYQKTVENTVTAPAGSLPANNLLGAEIGAGIDL